MNIRLSPGSPLPTTHTDFVVLGSGIAGLRAAIALGKEARVTVVSKGKLLEGNSIHAQGGVAVALNDEDVQIHREDTLQAGHGLCRIEAVDILMQEGPQAVEELIHWGAKFDRDAEGWALAKEAAHSRNRIMRAGGDATGNEIIRTLFQAAKQCANIAWMGKAFAIDLILNRGVCKGITILDESCQTLKRITARAVILATGGAGQIYTRTTNPRGATGDGAAIAYRAGARIENIEFVQFHPTTLSHATRPQFLLSEAMRGEGAVLKTVDGKSFMSQYHPAGDLAPRDVVTRAIWTECERMNLEHVLLDITHLEPPYLRNRFPTIFAACLECGIDITTHAIPVFPGAHYMMGGVWTDIDGSTTVPGLYAAGEVACSGVHGGNRLASNSLLEGLVFGKRAGEHALGFDSANARGVHTDDRAHVSATTQSKTTESWSVHASETIRSKLRQVMWGNVGIIRNRAKLTAALQQFAEWNQIYGETALVREEIELRNMLAVSHCIASAALRRTESIGAHYRSDAVETTDTFIRPYNSTRALAESA